MRKRASVKQKKQTPGSGGGASWGALGAPATSMRGGGFKASLGGADDGSEAASPREG